MLNQDLVTVEEAQQLLGVSRATFWNLVKRHRLARYRIPTNTKRVYFKREELLALREPVRVEDDKDVKTAT
jgi:excisionase family DNA binding protein